MQVNKLPETIKINFNELFNLKPDNRSKVTIFDKDTKEFVTKEIFRSYNSYLNTPEWDKNVKKSYMFLNKEDKIPSQFKPLLDFVQQLDNRYNQMVVNWYNKNDYIELHRDCTSKMINSSAPILTINLNESEDVNKTRHMIFQCVESGEMSSTPLLDKHYYIIDNNETHRHAVGTGLEKRISLTFRMMK